MPRHFDHRLLVGAVLVLAGGVGGYLAGLGPLSPPGGAVTSTAKTLAEVEPRTAVNVTNTPGNSSFVYIISQPGSYYLTGNVVAGAAVSGIAITAPNVTLDLNGWRVQGPGSATPTYGVQVSAASGPVAVHNGTVTSFGTSVYVGGTSTRLRAEGVDVGGCGAGFDVRNDAVLTRCSATGCTGAGFSGLVGCTLDTCLADGNGGGGFVYGESTCVSSCTARSNTGSGFLMTGGSALLRGCVAYQNSSAGFNITGASLLESCVGRSNGAEGISINGSATITHCICHGNTGNGMTMVGSGAAVVGGEYCFNTLSGIAGTSSAQIRDVNAVGNQRWGIDVVFNVLVSGCNCVSNGQGVGIADGAGIRMNSNCRAEGNHCTSNDIGLAATGSNNLIIRNSCQGNTTAFSIAAGNDDAQALSGGTAFVAANPWANFAL